MRNLDFVIHLLILLLITTGFAGLFEENTWILLTKAFLIAIVIFVGGEIILIVIEMKGGKNEKIQKKETN